MALLGVVFIIVAIRCISGRAKDVLGISIGSLIFGMFYTVGGMVLLPIELKKSSNLDLVAITLIVLFLFAALPCLAAVLALVGRKKYKAYRRAIARMQQR
jgi:hypothetical protein